MVAHVAQPTVVSRVLVAVTRDGSEKAAVVSEADGLALAERHGMPFFNVRPAEGVNVTEAFTAAAQGVLRAGVPRDGDGEAAAVAGGASGTSGDASGDTDSGKGCGIM